MTDSNRYILSLTVLILFCVLIFSSCSEKITSADRGGTRLQIDLSPAQQADLLSASNFRLTVTGPGIVDPIVESLILENGRLVGEVRVPAGPGRIFLLEAFDAAGKLIYSGSSTADVKPGATVDLRIDLYPRVPMIKLSPLYVEKSQTARLAYKIEIFNIRNLNEINMELRNNGQQSGNWRSHSQS